MLNTTKKVSIIIPTYCPDNEVVEAYNKFFSSLKKYTNREDYQLVVIEQGVQLVNELIPDIYIHKEKPIGYARAVNLGMAVADGDYLIVINNDIELSENWLENLVNDYEKEFNGMGLLSAMDYDRPGIVENESWYSLFIVGRRTFQTVGYLDEILNYRFHDQDYSIRLKKAGFKIGRTGNVKVKHKDSTTFKKMNINIGFEEKIMNERHGAILFSDWITKCQ
jgi:GT2 family glycosyltransferase